MTSASVRSRRLGVAEHLLEIEGNEWDTVTLVELALELDPVKSQSVQGALERIHAHDDREDASPEGGPHDNELHAKKSKVIIRIYIESTYSNDRDRHGVK